MRTAAEHDADIEIAKARAAGAVPAIALHLMSIVERLRDEADEQEKEMKRLYRIEEEARSAYNYHLSGRMSEPNYDEFWDANEMIDRLDKLGDALR